MDNIHRNDHGNAINKEIENNTQEDEEKLDQDDNDNNCEHKIINNDNIIPRIEDKQKNIIQDNSKNKEKEKEKEKDESIKFIIDEDSLMDFMFLNKNINRKPEESNKIQKSNISISNNEKDNKNNIEKKNNNNVNDVQFNFDKMIKDNKSNNNINDTQFNFDKMMKDNKNNIETNRNNNEQFNFEKNINNNNNLNNNNLNNNINNNNLNNNNTNNNTNNNQLNFNFESNFKNNQQTFNFNDNCKNINNNNNNNQFNFDLNFNNNQTFDFNKNFNNNNNLNNDSNIKRPINTVKNDNEPQFHFEENFKNMNSVSNNIIKKEENLNDKSEQNNKNDVKSNNKETKLNSNSISKNSEKSSSNEQIISNNNDNNKNNDKITNNNDNDKNIINNTNNDSNTNKNNNNDIVNNSNENNSDTNNNINSVSSNENKDKNEINDNYYNSVISNPLENKINSNNIGNNKINENLTNIIDKNDHDSEYGIIIPDSIKCKKMENTEFTIRKDLVIKISDPVKVESGFFTGKSVNYLVTTLPLKYTVRRKYSDFNWLRDTLINIFNTNLIPKLAKKGKVTNDKHDDAFIQKRMKFLEKFINFLIKDELIKSSKLMYDFLTIQKEDDFQHYKKLYDKIKVSPLNDVRERKSLDGEMNVKITKEKEIYLENIKDNSIFNGNLFKKLNNNFKLLQDEFLAVIKRFESISQVYRQLYDVSINYLDQNTISESYAQMENMFNKLSESFDSIKKFINSDIREYFKFIGNNFNCLSEMTQNVDLAKSNYLKNAKNLISKKNDLFKKGDISKWELSPSDKNNSQKLLKEKTLACMKMLPKETRNCIISKEIYGFYLNKLINEYERMRQINAVQHKKTICFYCKEQIVICSEYTRILGDITMTLDSCRNKRK